MHQWNKISRLKANNFVHSVNMIFWECAFCGVAAPSDAILGPNKDKVFRKNGKDMTCEEIVVSQVMEK